MASTRCCTASTSSMRPHESPRVSRERRGGFATVSFPRRSTGRSRETSAHLPRRAPGLPGQVPGRGPRLREGRRAAEGHRPLRGPPAMGRGQGLCRCVEERRRDRINQEAGGMGRGDVGLVRGRGSAGVGRECAAGRPVAPRTQAGRLDRETFSHCTAGDGGGRAAAVRARVPRERRRPVWKSSRRPPRHRRVAGRESPLWESSAARRSLSVDERHGSSTWFAES